MPRRHTPAPPYVAPRAYLDPVDDADAALGVISLAMSDPLQHETIVFALDDDGRGGTIVVVSDTHDPDDVAPVVTRICRRHQGDPAVCSLVVATVRPDGGLLTDDDRRWIAAEATAEDFGIELVEWFVIGPDGVWLPRVLAGDPERW